MTDQTMTCETLDALLGDYLEKTLDAADRAAVERHAARCGRCGELLVDLREIAVEARALPTLRPSRDLWSGISERIAPPVIELHKGRDEGRGTGDEGLGTRHSALGGD